MGEFDLMRYRIARTLIHAGLRIMPHGRARRELTAVIWEWGNKVRAEVLTARVLRDQKPAEVQTEPPAHVHGEDENG